MRRFLSVFMRMVLQSIVIGVVATIAMDLWNLVLWVTLGISLDWGILGRWIGHTLQGDFMLYGVNAASPIPYENVLGWIGHYVTGIMYAFTYLFFAVFIMHHSPSLPIALAVAWFFMLMPFCLYQPAIGLGYFAMAAEAPNYVRLVTVSMHTFFGCGLYVGYLITHRFWPWHKDKD